MEVKIFYSWQSDLHNSTNRGFIGDILERVAKSIHKDDSIQVEPVLDRDTQGVAGSPDIANTIFNKINGCQIFVCDVSIINNDSQNRPTPNPNVLVELGYAVGILGWERIVLVINTAFGSIESLPFDLRMRRVVNYELPKDIDKSIARKELEGKLNTSLRTIVTAIETQLPEQPVTVTSPWQQTMDAVENSQPNAVLLSQKYLNWLLNELDGLFPLYRNNARIDLMLSSDDDLTQQLVAEFADFSNALVLTKNLEIADTTYEFFSRICERYNYSSDHRGIVSKIEHDFYRFLGYEMFVCFISAFIKNNQWSNIGNLLIKEWYISNPFGTFNPTTVTFNYVLSQYLTSFNDINIANKLNRVFLPADTLNQRHQKEPFKKAIPAQTFMEADLFLWLRNEGNARPWYPWSSLYLDKDPEYLVKAVNRRFAEQVLLPFNVSDISTLREHISNRIQKAQNTFNKGLSSLMPWANGYDPSLIGTK